MVEPRLEPRQSGNVIESIRLANPLLDTSLKEMAMVQGTMDI